MLGKATWRAPPMPSLERAHAKIHWILLGFSQHLFCSSAAIKDLEGFWSDYTSRNPSNTSDYVLKILTRSRRDQIRSRRLFVAAEGVAKLLHSYEGLATIDASRALDPKRSTVHP